jgi:hypothetical protein
MTTMMTPALAALRLVAALSREAPQRPAVEMRLGVAPAAARVR